MGLSPFRSAKVHPNASLCSLGTLISLSSCSDVSALEIITGKVSSSPKLVYLRLSGNGFSSSLGGN